MDKQTKSGMPVDESKYSFTIPRTDEPREKILKLGAMITDRIGKVTGNDPEYWGLAGVVTDEMADVALKMKVRKPKTTAQSAALTGKSEEELEKRLPGVRMIDVGEALADALRPLFAESRGTGAVEYYVTERSAAFDEIVRVMDGALDPAAIRVENAFIL